MIPYSRLLLILIGIAITSSTGFAQDVTTNMELNRAPLRYFSGVELSQFANEDQVKSDQIIFYFTQSFEVIRTDCNGCEVDYEMFYNQEVFNIVNFESLREASTEVTFIYKKKYEIKLLSDSDVLMHLSGITSAEVLNLHLDRAFPQWTSTENTESDYELYKAEVDQWAKDFPNQYRDLTSSSSFLKISFSDYRTLRSYRQEELLTRPDGYLIID